MSVFTIADLHLSLNGNKPMDVFPGWEGYLPKLEKNWRAVVRPEDTVVLPGDLSWAMSLEEAVADFGFLESLPGHKIVLKGNHDYWWTTMRKMNAFLQAHAYATITILHNTAVAVGGIAVCGSRGWFFDDTEAGDRKILLREAGRLETSIQQAEKTGLEPVVFLHYPPVYSGNECEELLDVLLRHHIRRCYYGHLHGRAAATAVQGEYRGICLRLVSADSLRFAPIVVESCGL